jgi:hypothetical protein
VPPRRHLGPEATLGVNVAGTHWSVTCGLPSLSYLGYDGVEVAGKQKIPDSCIPCGCSQEGYADIVRVIIKVY